MPLDSDSVLILIAAVGLAFLRRRLDWRLGWAALLVVLLTLVMPRHFGGGDLADARLVPVALMLGCLAIDVRATRWVLFLSAPLFLVRLSVSFADWREQSARLEAALPALAKLPQGARLAAAVPIEPHRWGNAELDHTGSYATLYRDALVNTHFALPGVHMLTVRGMDAGFSDPSQRIEARPGEPVDLSHFPPAAHADYLWYVGDNPVGVLPAGATVLHRAPGSLLVRLANAPRGR